MRFESSNPSLLKSNVILADAGAGAGATFSVRGNVRRHSLIVSCDSSIIFRLENASVILSSGQPTGCNTVAITWDVYGDLIGYSMTLLFPGATTFRTIIETFADDPPRQNQ